MKLQKKEEDKRKTNVEGNLKDSKDKRSPLTVLLFLLLLVLYLMLTFPNFTIQLMSTIQ